jgi:hypothetical protein
MFARAAILAVLLIACGSGQDRAAPAVNVPQAETAVTRHVKRFVTQGRTNRAYAELSVALADDTVGNPSAAAEAELRQLGLAAPLAEAARSRTLTEQVDALALTVWPALLARPLTGATPDAALRPHAGEGANDYLARLCNGPFRTECGGVLPEERPTIVRALAMRAANERMRAALATCLFCTTRDQDWDRLGWTWESLDREASGAVTSLSRQSQHPVAVTDKPGLSRL